MGPMTPDPSAPSEIQWAARLDETKAFATSHGRLPRQKADSAEERRLGNWLTTQRRKADGTRGFTPHTEEQAAALNTELPGWRGRIASPPVPWEQRLVEVKTYRDAYGKWPSCRSSDPQTKILAAWVGSQRHNRNGSPEVQAARLKVLDEQLPGWNETPAQAWFRIADDVAAFRDRIGEWPAYGSREATVRRMAKWLSDQRAGRNVSPEREAYLNEHLPGWRTGLGHGNRPLELWERQVAAVEHFRDTHGRLPSHYRDPREVVLGTWLHQQRNDKAMSPARRDVLDRRLPGWEATSRVSIQELRAAQEASWRGKLDDVVRFVSVHDRAPSRADGERLHGWLTRLRDREIPPERQAVLDERLPGWRGLPSKIRRLVRAA